MRIRLASQLLEALENLVFRVLYTKRVDFEFGFVDTHGA
jgi:hypothetical protein